MPSFVHRLRTRAVNIATILVGIFLCRSQLGGLNSVEWDIVILHHSFDVTSKLPLRYGCYFAFWTSFDLHNGSLSTLLRSFRTWRHSFQMKAYLILKIINLLNLSNENTLQMSFFFVSLAMKTMFGMHFCQNRFTKYSLFRVQFGVRQSKYVYRAVFRLVGSKIVSKL